MGELRWILLLAGVVFLAALAAWEMRRSRQGRRELSGSALPAPRPAAMLAIRGEPDLGHLPEEFASGARGAGAGPSIGRTPGPNPPVVQLPPLGEPDAAAVEAPIELASQGATEEVVGQDAAVVMDAVDAQAQAQAQAEAEAEAEAEVMEATDAADAEAARAMGTSVAPDTAPLRVDWPPEGARQIIALRLTAVTDQRLSGRTTRQALAACGFVHGRYGIFHQPSADGRSLLSCASLSKPGIFDPAAMDFQRFAGLSLFMVLPGPLPAEAALERLLETGSDLAQRLRAQLQDEQGHMLDAPAIEDLRDAVRLFSAPVSASRPTEPAA